MDPLPRPAQPPVVLVVDDFEDGRELVAEYLAFRGFAVHTAKDGAEAIEVADAVRPDVILMDLTMPGINGWQAVRILKSNPSTENMIVVALTAHALTRETQAAKDAGFDGIICKPFDLEALADALPRLLTHGAEALDVPGLSLKLPPAKPRQSPIRTRTSTRTSTPDPPPPKALCPTCDKPLEYLETVFSGVKPPERWDQFRCSAHGRFEYRHRTRDLRRVR